MRLLIILILFVPLLSFGFRQGEPAGFSEKLVDAAVNRTKKAVTYDPAYVRIKYPGGDVEDSKGVCSDVVVRSYRKLGVDLQVDVHKDMKANFNLYPKVWGLSRPDKNIDHRRVYNLMKLFERKGLVLNKSLEAGDYQPGDIVAWMLPGNRPHIGIVSSEKSISGRYKIVHNIGTGTVLEDMLFDYKIIGHYRYYGKLK